MPARRLNGFSPDARSLHAWWRDFQDSARRIAGSTVLALGLFLTLLIGLREQVGGDWFNYFPCLDRSFGLPFAEIFQGDEPGYGLLNWIGANIGGGVYLVNTVCGLIFSISLPPPGLPVASFPRAITATTACTPSAPSPQVASEPPGAALQTGPDPRDVQCRRVSGSVVFIPGPLLVFCGLVYDN